MNIEIKYKKVKNISLKMKDKNHFILTCPLRTLQYVIDEMINKYSLKMMNKSKRMQYLYDFSCEDKWIIIFGTKYYLNLICNPSQKKKYYFEWDKAISDQLNVYFKHEFVAKEFYDYLILSSKSEVLEYLQDKLLEQAKIMQLNHLDIQVRLKKLYTAWGNCNYKKHIITFSTFLIHLKKELIDYVIIHELSHLYIHNHSKKFWSLVYNYDNNFESKQKELKSFLILKPER